MGRFSFATVLSSKRAADLLRSVEDLPVLVVAGSEDALVSVKSAQTMASKLVNSVSNPLPFVNLPISRTHDFAMDLIYTYLAFLTIYFVLLVQRIVTISGCGHLPHEECPKALLSALSPFISRLVPSEDSLQRL